MPANTLTAIQEKKTVLSDADIPLLWVISDELGLTGTKYGCGKGLCGACKIHYRGAAVKACMVKVSSVLDGNITTIEGLSHVANHPVQQAWTDLKLPQCGYCQPRQIMAATALLTKKTNPSESEINIAIARNIRRCGTYGRIRSAIRLATGKINP